MMFCFCLGNRREARLPPPATSRHGARGDGEPDAVAAFSLVKGRRETFASSQYLLQQPLRKRRFSQCVLSLTAKEMNMLRFLHGVTAALVISIGLAVGATGATAQPTAPTTSNAPSPISPPIIAKDIQGLDVFSSDGQQVGKVAKVNVISDGNVKDVEVQSGGFLGFFSKTYVVPVDKLNKKGGRVELSMTSEQAKQLIK